MAPDQLVADRAHDVPHVEVPVLPGQRGHEDDLQQEVPGLLPNLAHVPLRDGLRKLVGLLRNAGAQVLQRLLPVPRTASRSPQPFDQADNLVEIMPFIPAVAAIAAIVAIITTITIHAARPDPRVFVAGNHSHTSDGL